MISENICYATLFVAEALTAWLYLEYLFRKKKSSFFLIFSFSIGYSLLFAVSLLDNTTLNAIFFCFVNFVLVEWNYQCNARTALLHTAFLCFIMVGAEILVALLISLFGYEFAAYTYNFRVMVVLVILSKLLYLMFSVIGSRIFAPHKHTNEEPQFMVLFCSLPILSAAIAIVTVYLGMTAGITGTVGVMTIMIIVTLLIVNLVMLNLILQFAKGKYLRCSDANNFISCMASPTKTIGNDRCGRLGNPVRVRSFTRCCMCRSLYSWSDPVTGETWEGGIQTQEQIASQCTSQKTSHDRD